MQQPVPRPHGLTRVSRTNGTGDEGYGNLVERHALALLPALLPHRRWAEHAAPVTAAGPGFHNADA